MPGWVQIEVQLAPDGALRVQATASSAGAVTPPVSLGVARQHVLPLADLLPGLSRARTPLSAEQRAWTRQLFQALLDNPVGQLVGRLRGDGREPVLVRWMVADPALRAVPWEAMRGPGDLDAELALHPQLGFARGVHSSEPSIPREVRGAVRLLAVGSEEMRYAVEDLRRTLEEPHSTGELEWLEPALGPLGHWQPLVDRLRTPPAPHVLHFVGHGRVRGGEPELLFGEDQWVAVDTLATVLESSVKDQLRVVYLEACSGADPGSLASAAERLVHRGVDAVVAHLWEVPAPAARAASRAFYRALVGASGGDVVSALTAARQSLAGEPTPDFLCPVLFLRGNEPRLLDLRRRRLVAPLRPLPAGATLDPRLAAIRRDLEETLARPSTLFVGDALPEEQVDLGLPRLRESVARLVERRAGVDPALSSLLQHVELAEARPTLRTVVERALRPAAAAAAPEVARSLDAVAARFASGLVVTLPWLPLVEEAIAFHHPQVDVHVVHPEQPGDLRRTWVYSRLAGASGWTESRENVEAKLAEIDLRRSCVIMRLFGGFAAQDRLFVGEPVLTEDDLLANLEGMRALPSSLLAFFQHNPVVMLGLSPLRWGHRELLRRLSGGQPLAAGSLAVLPAAADEADRRYWTSESGPGGRARSVRTVEWADLVAALGAG